jgi:hypothetical protein
MPSRVSLATTRSETSNMTGCCTTGLRTGAEIFSEVELVVAFLVRIGANLSSCTRASSKDLFAPPLALYIVC